MSPTSPTRAWLTEVRRPMCACRASSWTTVFPAGYQSRYGKSVPTRNSTSQSSIACAAAGLPISPDWPTWKRLSCSRPSLALRVSTIGAWRVSASWITSARASRAPRPTSRVTLLAASRAAAASATWPSAAAVQRAAGRERRRALPGHLLVAEVARQGQHGDALVRVRGVDRLLEQVGHLGRRTSPSARTPPRRRRAGRCRPPGRSRCPSPRSAPVHRWPGPARATSWRRTGR